MMCKECVLCWTLAFLLDGLEFWYVLGRGCLPELPSIKNNLGSESLMSFLGWNITHILLHFHCWRGCVLCDPSWPTHEFLQILPVFSPHDWVVDPCKISHHLSYECNYRLRSTSFQQILECAVNLEQPCHSGSCSRMGLEEGKGGGELGRTKAQSHN